ncbi:MAG: DUF1801 domain-containing protein [Ignavibacteria bacterium]|nr:DUF1801 domain-containing protein [Ignavibacteria bacterium]HAX48728.1 hypothetical protein [Bacteroidota bacterium]HRE11963.1 DUF1801 domain-containing protein [Ignavibacteria bacterium]HRF65805.1 DUF1801 domain-containing protein [Ignavibacteria bacterium]
MRQKFITVNDYMKSLEPEVRKTLQAVRKSVLSSAKGLEEVISYNIPGYKLNGKAVVYIAGFKNHCSLYPMTRDLAEKLGNRLDNFRVKGSTLQYEIGNPLPERLVKIIVKERIKLLKM